MTAFPQKTVFVLGAGASAAAGAPVMKDFLDVAEGLVSHDRVSHTFKDQFKLVFSSLDRLRSAQIKGSIDVDNIESVFAGFEMASLLGRFDGFSEPQYVELLGAVKAVIAHTLELSLAFRRSDGQLAPPSPYGPFGDLLRDMGASTTSVLTFNYDVGLDYACVWNGLGLKYCIGEHDGNGYEVLKLHGSVNWNYCAKCKDIRPNFRPFQPAGLVHYDEVRLPVSQYMAGVTCSKCNQSAHEPMLVPPTWSKTQHYDAIKSVWRRAALRISEAENIFVIGYSLPGTDEFFRYLFALGTIGKTRIKRFWIFNPDPAVQERFRGLLGPEVLKRFETFQTKFADAIPRLRADLKIANPSGVGAS